MRTEMCIRDRRRTNTQHLTNDSGRASLYISRKGSMTLEAAMAVPFFLCAVTALLYLFVFTAQNGQAYRRLMEKAEMLAVTAGQITEDDPYIRLYDYETDVYKRQEPERDRCKDLCA